MKKTIYLIRHSGGFVDLEYENKITFEEKSRNMILSVEAEDKIRALSKIDELVNIDSIYSSNSARAIATAKYIAHNNDISVKIENNFNERKFGIQYIEDLPEDFIVKQFINNDYKLENGESLNEVMDRIKVSLNKILASDDKRIVIVLHGIALMCFIKIYCDVIYNEKTFTISKDDKILYDNMIKAPDLFKLVIDDMEMLEFEHINS